MIDVPRDESAFADPPKDQPPEKKYLGFGPFPGAFRTAAQPAALPETSTFSETPAVADTPAELAADEEDVVSGVEGKPPGQSAWGSWNGDDPARAPDTLDLDLAMDEGGETGDLADRSEEAEEPEATASDAGNDPWEPSVEERDDVDRFSLAQEFGQLLQRGEDPADG